jgi:hypothetical protein
MGCLASTAACGGNRRQARGSLLAGRHLLAAEILGGRRVGIRIEPTTLMFYDLATRELLRTCKNPLPQTKSQACAAPCTALEFAACAMTCGLAG